MSLTSFSRRKKRQQLEQFNIIVAGQAHSGKTSFLRTLHRTLSFVKPASSDAEAVVPEASYPLGPTTGISSQTFPVAEGRARFSLTLVDTPGFVDDGTVPQQSQLLLTYIENHFEMRLIEESRVKRDPRALHHQIHACIYFLDPTYVGIRPVDVSVLKQLERRVNILLIVGKSDLLTSQRLNEVKRGVRRDIRKYKLKVYTFPDYEMDEEEEGEEEAKAEMTDDTNRSTGRFLRSLVPFSIVNMEEFETSFVEGEPDELLLELYDAESDQEDNKVVEESKAIKQNKEASIKSNENFLGRRYPWGEIHVVNPNHCDFMALRDALFVSHRRTLKEITIDALYEKYRTERMKERRASIIATRRESSKSGSAHATSTSVDIM